MTMADGTAVGPHQRAPATSRDADAPADSRRRGVVWEYRLFGGATVVGVCHAVDDAVLHRQPAVPVSQHLLALAVTVALCTAAVLSFPRLRPGARAGLALTFGALALTNGATHVLHVAVAGPSRSDVTGVLAALAGLALLGLSIVIPYRHRGENRLTVRRRWVNRIGWAAAVVVWAFYVVMPVCVAIVQTHTVRQPIDSPPSDRYTDVTFESSDGLRLSGWYLPSRNRAAVVIVSSAGGDRNGSVQHAELLASHGYGVLLYDARGTGESEGTPNGYGWTWDRDVRGALGFLRARPDVDPDRIGGLGLSTGADVLLEVAAKDHDLKALVCDGATGRRTADVDVSVFERPEIWAMFTAVHFLSGMSPGPPLADLVPDISPTPLLLIASGSIPQELPANTVYAARAREPVALWKLPDVHHTAAIREVADEYEARVIGLFDLALLGHR
jgi:fermentation-respiration switch protein FrsA (DUF1100 family)